MKISEAVHKEIHRSFEEMDIREVIAAFGSAPDPINSSERIQFAILKVAKGNLQEFKRALREARTDWRDILVWAGMAQMNWPDVVVAAGMADENWRNRVVKRGRRWWQFWK